MLLDPSLFDYVVGFWGSGGKLLDHLSLEENTYIVVGTLKNGFRGRIGMLWQKSIVLSNSFLLLCPTTSNVKDLVGMRLSSRVQDLFIMYELPHTTSWLLRGNHENSDPLRSLAGEKWLVLQKAFKICSTSHFIATAGAALSMKG